MAADIVVVGMVVEDMADHKVVDIVVEPVVVDMVGQIGRASCRERVSLCV